ncbi:MAG: hypothetical protein K2N60_10090 [Oscillospiraceae bacterium]|nr:hypothetical protein [Oscillospiraceae bacterium]
MKIKKIIAGVAAAAMTVSTMAAMSVSAINEGGTVIDFEDGDCSFVYMNVDDAGADPSVLSVEDYNGSKRLKVDVTNKKNGPKVWFDLDKITDRSNTVQIRKITFDLTIVPKSEEGIVGWVGGAVGAAGGFDLEAKGKGQVNPSWSQGTWDGGAYDPGVPAEVKIERKFMMKNEFYTEDGINPFFGLMKWATTDEYDEYVMYVDNVQLLDSKGNALPIGVTPAPAETEAAPEETEAAPAETEAAPVEDAALAEDIAVDDDADEDIAAPAETAAPVAEPAVEPAAVEPAPAPAVTTTPAATGNTAVASIAAVMAIAGAAAIVAKKRK